MSAPTIKVNPASITAYGTKAQRQFDSIRADLQSMVNATHNVPYEGDNAVHFKTECGRIVGEFSKAMLADMQEIANAVKTTTSNIAQSLGGHPVNISVNGHEITPQAVAKGDGTQSANTVALRALPGLLTTKYAAIEAALSAHLSALEGTQWEGTGKRSAVEVVSQRTSAARKDCEASKHSIIDYINKQLAAVESADALRGGG